MPFSYRKWLAGSTGASCRRKKSRKKRNCSAVSLPRYIDYNISSVSKHGLSCAGGHQAREEQKEPRLWNLFLQKSLTRPEVIFCAAQ